MKNIFKIIFVFFLSYLSGNETFLPPLPAFPSEEPSIVVDSTGNATAVWNENGIIKTSDLSIHGNWSLPFILSSPVEAAKNPLLEIDPAGNATVLWTEKDRIKIAIRSPGTTWSYPARIILPRENPSASFTSTLPCPRNPALALGANAIDAPTGGTLSGVHVGFAAGTAAPANGAIIAGRVGVGIASPSVKFQVFDSSTLPSNELGSFLISGTATSGPGNPRLCFGINYSASQMNYSWIQSVENGIVARPLLLQPSTGPVGIGASSITSTSNTALQVNSAGGSGTSKIVLTGNSLDTTTSTDGISLALLHNASTNRQLVVGDSALMSSSASNRLLRFLPNITTIDAIATNTSTVLPLTLGNTGNTLSIQGSSIQAAGYILQQNDNAGIYMARFRSNSGNDGVDLAPSSIYAQSDVFTGRNLTLGSWNSSAHRDILTLTSAGTVGIGTASPGLSFIRVLAGSTSAITMSLEGTLSADDGFNEEFILAVSTSMTPNTSATTNFFPLIVNPTVTLSANSSQYAGIYQAPFIVTTASNFNLTNYYGIRMVNPGKSGSGIISNAYSAFFAAPTIGSANVALYADNATIGYTGVTPPTNGAIIQGNVGIGTTTPGTNILSVVGSSGTINITSVGNIVPSVNKVLDLGATGNRFNNIYYVSATTGTSRLAKSRTMCDHCNTTMHRGTGAVITLGEKADYIPVFCLSCGAHKVEALAHLSKTAKEQILPPSQMEFLGFKVCQYSGNSRGIQVLFKYDNDLHNSTLLSDVEYEQFLQMGKEEKDEYIQSLGIREWRALEEVRLMKEECALLQTHLDQIYTGCQKVFSCSN